MSIQEQKLLSAPDDDQPSTSITLHLPQYGGAVGGLSCQMPTGPILGDPADVRQGILGAPVDHPLVRPTGMTMPATTWPLPHQHNQQQIIHPPARTYNRAETPPWNPQQYPHTAPTPAPRHATPTNTTPIPQSVTPAPTWYPVGNRRASSCTFFNKGVT